MGHHVLAPPLSVVRAAKSRHLLSLAFRAVVCCCAELQHGISRPCFSAMAYYFAEWQHGVSQCTMLSSVVSCGCNPKHDGVR